MEFRIADTFVNSLARLNNQDQKAVKTTVVDLQINASSPGLSFHKLDREQDPRFASVRVNDDIRLIVHQSPGSLLICYAAHHDDAYRWAERRKIETHPVTGAAQLVEIRETIREIVIPTYVTEARPKPPLFAGHSDEELLGYGVPLEWLADVRAANEDTYLELTDHLPTEAAEALLELAVGGTPLPSSVPVSVANPFDHPDAQRRFRSMHHEHELALALDYPWEKWTIFLHPEQRHFATGNYSGPARVSGSAGTGKTIVALHRAVHLAEINPKMRVLLVTFSETLSNALKVKLRTLLHERPHLGDQIEVYAMNALGERLYGFNLGKARLASHETIQALLAESAAKVSGIHLASTSWLPNGNRWWMPGSWIAGKLTGMLPAWVAKPA